MSAVAKFDYSTKFAKISPQTLFSKLPDNVRLFVQEQAFEYRLTQQELRELCQISNDLEMWKEGDICAIWPTNIRQKKQLLSALRNTYHDIQAQAKSYSAFSKLDKPKTLKPKLVSGPKQNLGLGYCPVASSKTRCCNLLTLDAVERCGFDCSYCSIQSFYHENEVRFDADFAQKLKNIKLDPERFYHIGTGQSSDSLMWGNHNGNLDALCEFAEQNPNVILELKTKSKNIGWLLDNDYPENILCTWSLNPQDIIDHEEHLTASLAERISSARKIADKHRLVGFHFHPMIWYEHSQQAYGDIARKLIETFTPEEVALISMGSLTYSKNVINTIRKRDFKSKILQMPMTEVAGKYAYPEETKIALFSDLYRELRPWHEKVFFYLCMEPASLWAKSFGFEPYASNDDFELAMKQAYHRKIQTIRAV